MYATYETIDVSNRSVKLQKSTNKAGILPMSSSSRSDRQSQNNSSQTQNNARFHRSCKHKRLAILKA